MGATTGRATMVGAAAVSTDVEALHRAEKAGALVMSARNAARKGRREEARAQLQQALTLAPTDCGALELLGDMFLEEGEQEKAIAVFERGRKHHPRHAAFEEKIAEAHIDLREMETDRLLREQALADPLGGESARAEVVRDRKPNAVAFLSLLLPGAGQFYNEETERGMVYFLIAMALFCAWCVPWRMGWAMAGLAKIWIGAMLLAQIATHVSAAVDAARGAMRDAEERKRLLGV